MTAAALSPRQSALLAFCDRTGWIPPSGLSVCPGIHFCPDWGGMAVCDASPEKACCTCTTGRDAE